MVRTKQVDGAIAEVRQLLQELRPRVHPSPNDKKQQANKLSEAQARAIYDWVDDLRRDVRKLVNLELKDDGGLPFEEPSL